MNKSSTLPVCIENQKEHALSATMVTRDGAVLVTASTSLFPSTVLANQQVRQSHLEQLGGVCKPAESHPPLMRSPNSEVTRSNEIIQQSSIYVTPLLFPPLNVPGIPETNDGVAQALQPRRFCPKCAATLLYDESLFDPAIRRVSSLANGFVTTFDPTAPLQSQSQLRHVKRRRSSASVSSSTDLSEDETVSWYHTSLARESRNVNTLAFARSSSNLALMQMLSRNILDDVSANKRYTSNVTCTVVFLACDIFRRFLRLKFEVSSASAYVLSVAPPAKVEPSIDTFNTTVRTVVLPLTSVNSERASLNTQVDRLIKVTSNCNLSVSSDDCLSYFQMLQLKHYLTACMWIAHKMSTVKTHDAFNFISSTVRTVTKNKLHSADASELVKNERHILSVTQFEVLLPTACDFIMFFASLFFGEGFESDSIEATVVTRDTETETSESCTSLGTCTFDVQRDAHHPLLKKRRVSETTQMCSVMRAKRKSNMIDETPRAIEQQDELFLHLTSFFGAHKNKVHKSKPEAEFRVKSRSHLNWHQHKHRNTSGSLSLSEDPLSTRLSVSRLPTSNELIHSSCHNTKSKTIVFKEKCVRDFALALLRIHYLTLTLGCFRPSEIAFACVTSALADVSVPREHQEVHWRTVYKFSASISERLMLDIRNIILIHVKMHKWTVQVD